MMQQGSFFGNFAGLLNFPLFSAVGKIQQGVLFQ